MNVRQLIKHLRRFPLDSEVEYRRRDRPSLLRNNELPEVWIRELLRGRIVVTA